MTFVRFMAEILKCR